MRRLAASHRGLDGLAHALIGAWISLKTPVGVLAVAWRDLCIVARAVWLNLALYAGLLLAGAALLRLSGAYPEAGLLDLLVASFHMSHLESWARPGDGVLPALLTFALPLLAGVVLGAGVLRVAAVFVWRRQHQEEWDALVARTFCKHTVICGVGELGRAIYRELIAADPDAAVVLIDTRPNALAEMGRGGPNVCHVQADMTNVDTLKAVDCQEASLIILASGDDAANLEAGFKALELNPRAEIWIRLYRSSLASLLDCTAKPNVHFFSPYERAARLLVGHLAATRKPQDADESS